jgi:predicted RNA-binding protein (virulence factor B family)
LLNYILLKKSGKTEEVGYLLSKYEVFQTLELPKKKERKKKGKSGDLVSLFIKRDNRVRVITQGWSTYQACGFSPQHCKKKKKKVR